jgi:dihydrofolate reductase
MTDAKLLFSATTSLDGFMAGPDGDMSWLLPMFGPNPDVDWLVDAIGALLIGRRTWDGDDPNAGTDAEGAFGGQWSGPQFLVTHRPLDEPVEGTTVVDDLPRAIALARDAARGRYVNVLGADLGRQCLELGELDEIMVIVAPVLLGGGTRMFDLGDRPDVELETISVSHAPLATNMHFRVVHRG